MDPSAEIEILGRELETAANTLLDAAERGLELVRAARAGDPAAIDGIEAALRDVLQACAFQDIAGQRLSRLTGAKVNGAVDPQLEGPRTPEEGGLDQAAADLLFGAT